MDIWTAIRIVARRWYVFVPGMILCLVALFLVNSGIQREYQTSGSLILLTPQIANDLEPTENPYLISNTSLRTTAVVVEQIVSSDQQRSDIKASGARGRYEISAAENSPTLNVVAVADTPADAQQTVNIVFDAVEVQLALLQESVGVPQEQRISTRPLIAPAVVTKLAGDRQRTLLALAILGIIASASLAVAVDSGLALRRRNQGGGEASETTPTPSTPEPPKERPRLEHIRRSGESIARRVPPDGS